MRRGIMPIVAVTTCLGLAACGGSSGSSSTTPAATSTTSAAATAFATQLSSICRRANAAYNNAPTRSGQVAAIQHYLSVFHGVNAPQQLQSTYSQYLGVLAKELAALKKGDNAGLIKLRNTQAGPLVRKLGATGCFS